MKLRELVVTLGFDIDQKKLKQIEDSVTELKDNLRNLTVVAAGAAATVFGFAKVTADAANNVRNVASQLGIGTRDLQALGYAAEQNGATFEDMVSGLQSLSGAMNSARLGSGTQADAFRRLGITFKDTQGQLLPVVQVYQQLADRMSRMDDGTKKVAIATDILGGSAGKLLQTLSQGAGVAGKAGAELEAMGGIISDAQFVIAKDFQLALGGMFAQLGAIGKQIGFAIIPQVTRAIGIFRSWMQANREFVRIKMSEVLSNLALMLRQIFRVGRSVLEVVTGLYKGADLLLKPLGGVAIAFRALAYGLALFAAGRSLMALASIADGVAKIGRAALLANTKALLFPILIAAAAAAIYLIVDDIVAYFDGRPSVLGFLLRNKEKLLKDFEAFLAKTRKFIFDFTQKGIELFLKLYDVPSKQAAIVARKIRSVFERVFDVISSAVVVTMSVMMSVIEDSVKLLVDLISEPLKTFENIGGRLVGIVANAMRIALISVLDVIKAIGNLFGINPATIQKVWKFFLDTGLTVINALQQAMEFIFQGLVNYVFAILEKVIGAIKGTVQLVSGIIADPKAAIEAAKNKVITVLTDNPIAREAESLLGFGTSIYGDVKDKITGSPSQLNSTNNQGAVNFSPTINVTAPAGSNADDFAAKIKQTVEDSFRSELRKSGTVLTPQIEY